MEFPARIGEATAVRSHVKILGYISVGLCGCAEYSSVYRLATTNHGWKPNP